MPESITIIGKLCDMPEKFLSENSAICWNNLVTRTFSDMSEQKVVIFKFSDMRTKNFVIGNLGVIWKEIRIIREIPEKLYKILKEKTDEVIGKLVICQKNILIGNFTVKYLQKHCNSICTKMHCNQKLYWHIWKMYCNRQY